MYLKFLWKVSKISKGDYLLIGIYETNGMRPNKATKYAYNDSETLTLPMYRFHGVH